MFIDFIQILVYFSRFLCCFRCYILPQHSFRRSVMHILVTISVPDCRTSYLLIRLSYFYRPQFFPDCIRRASIKVVFISFRIGHNAQFRVERAPRAGHVTARMDTRAMGMWLRRVTVTAETVRHGVRIYTSHHFNYYYYRFTK